MRFAVGHRVGRLMKQDGSRALVGYGKRPRALNGPTGAAAGNVLARAFKAAMASPYLGHRHYLHPNLRGIVLSGRRAGSVRATSDR